MEAWQFPPLHNSSHKAHSSFRKESNNITAMFPSWEEHLKIRVRKLYQGLGMSYFWLAPTRTPKSPTRSPKLQEEKHYQSHLYKQFRLRKITMPLRKWFRTKVPRHQPRNNLVNNSSEENRPDLLCEHFSHKPKVL